MTIAQGGNFIQGLVKNGVIRGRDTLDVAYYNALVMIARDYILFQKKGIGELLSTNASVVSEPKTYKIDNGKVTLPTTLNVQGITNLELLSASGQYIERTISPLSPSAKNMADNFFIYYIPYAGMIEFKNLPFNAKKVRLYNIAGADENDTVTNDIMFMIVKEVMKLGEMSEQKRKDTSADGNTQDDAIMSQIRLQENQTNKIV